jgi:hypothetical protein
LIELSRFPKGIIRNLMEVEITVVNHEAALSLRNKGFVQIHQNSLTLESEFIPSDMTDTMSLTEQGMELCNLLHPRLNEEEAEVILELHGCLGPKNF